MGVSHCILSNETQDLLYLCMKARFPSDVEISPRVCATRVCYTYPDSLCLWGFPLHVLSGCKIHPPLLCAAPPKTQEVRLRYYSGWDAPTIHACAAGGEWTSAVMERDASGALTWQATVAEGAEMEGGGVAEFVITDGADDWDKSPSGENYKLPGVGLFVLRDGNLTHVEEEVEALV